MTQNTKEIIKSVKKSIKKLRDWNKEAKLALEKSSRFTKKIQRKFQKKVTSRQLLRLLKR